jgi:hypothetical protein
MSTFEKITAITNIVIAVAAVVTFLLVYFQLKEARNTAHLDQRAWVGPMKIDGKLPEPNLEFVVSIHVENSGKTFARKVAVQWHIREAAKPSAPDFDKEMIPTGGTVNSIGLLPPHGTYYIKAGGDLKPDEVTVGRIKSGESRVFVFGKITYLDVFDCPHWTTFCYVLRKDGTYDIWETHNDADDNRC